MQYLGPSHVVGAIALLILGGAAACREEGAPAGAGLGDVVAEPPPYVPPPEACDPAPAAGVFAPCNDGQGIFGTWTVDRLGLPAYDYGLDQRFDERAVWFHTEAHERRDHWHAFGNHRVNATFSNDGFVEVLLQDRGPQWLALRDAGSGAWGGGVSYLHDGDEAWSTAHAWLPEGATSSRRFGSSYVETTTVHRDLRVVRRTYAPAGDHPYLLVDVAIENLGDESRTVAHHEAWDVARRALETEWAVSGDPDEAFPAQVRARRDARNALFDERVRWDDRDRTLTVHRAHAAGVTPSPPDAPSAIDWYPAEPFLAVLIGEPTDTWSTDEGFFGGADPSRPAAVVEGREGEGTSTGERSGVTTGADQGRALVVRTDLQLAPGEVKPLRFAYGARPWGQEEPSIDPAHRHTAVDPLAHAAGSLRAHMMFFRSDEAPFLHRELAWHSAQLEASVGWRDYWNTRVVPQGSAYLYLHGADGAARDLGLFAVPLVYTHPELARDELRLYMGIQRASDGGFAYAFQGHGVLDDGRGLHHAPSDVEIFFLWALGEYLGATGDPAFLDQRVPFWPRESLPDATTWDHLVAAVRHLFDDVGTGEHGLVRIGTGDWSDRITFEAADRDLAIRAGESVPNTQMAIVVLPRIADLVADRDPALAAEIRARVEALRGALRTAWGGSFYGRAYLGDGALHRGDAVDLEAQVWALAGDLFESDDDRTRTIAAVHDQLDRPSPAGATLRADGEVWPAMGALLTWGYSRTRPDLAWDHFVRNTMVGHARAYPDVWYGIWSGPDGTNGPRDERPGQAWLTAETPMTDFPVMNNNQHAMPLLAALRMAGVEATARGLRVGPKVPSRSFALRTELVDVEQEGDTLAVTYRPLADASRELVLEAPEGELLREVRCDGVLVGDAAGAREAAIEVSAPLGAAVRCVARSSVPPTATPARMLEVTRGATWMGGAE